MLISCKTEPGNKPIQCDSGLSTHLVSFLFLFNPGIYKFAYNYPIKMVGSDDPIPLPKLKLYLQRNKFLQI